MVAGVIDFRGHGHRGWGEVLNLFEMEIKPFGLDRELCHVYFVATWMGGDEIGDKLLAQVMALVYGVEQALELLELAERRFAHDVENPIFGMFGGNFQTTTYMVGNQLLIVASRSCIDFRTARLVHRQVISHAAPDKGFLDSGKGVDGMVDVEQRTVVIVEVGARLRMETARSETFGTDVLVASTH